MRRFLLAACCLFLTASTASAQTPDPLTQPYPPDQCESCAGWNEPQAPFRLHGNTYYVGTRGLSALLVTSPDGHVLLDGGLPDSAPLILDNVRALGFRPQDIRLLLNSHPHFDHAGGLAALQHATGARVAASPASAPVLRAGQVGPDDPQHAIHLAFPPLADVDVFTPGDTLRVGRLALRAHATAGHTPGGTSWSWTACDDDDVCLDVVYADSQTPVSADGFRYTGDAYPTALADYAHGHRVLETLPCDLLVTTHPGASSLWERYAEGPQALVDDTACRRYAEKSRAQLAERVAREQEEAQQSHQSHDAHEGH